MNTQTRPQRLQDTCWRLQTRLETGKVTHLPAQGLADHRVGTQQCQLLSSSAQITGGQYRQQGMLCVSKPESPAFPLTSCWNQLGGSRFTLGYHF